MNLIIKKIRLDELESFTKSNSFKKLSVVPITPERVKSYINNPNSKPEDIVLFLGFIEQELVAFRSVFAGIVNDSDKQIRFGWCSGNWVHLNFRRKGFSKLLLNEAYSDWNNKLMFTNYAPNSEKLYIESGWFNPIHEFKGVRVYNIPKTRKLISKADANIFFKLLYSFIDNMIYILSTFLSIFYTYQKNGSLTFETGTHPDEACYKLESQGEIKPLFNRDETELQWIFQYPWISDTNDVFVNKYPFSSNSKSFTYKTVKIFRQNNLVGYFIFSIRSGHMKTLHFNIPQELEKELAEYIKQYVVNNKIEILTVYNSTIANLLFARKFPFLHVKKYGQKIYSSFDIVTNKKIRFQDGDGDIIFT